MTTFFIACAMTLLLATTAFAQMLPLPRPPLSCSTVCGAGVCSTVCTGG